MKTEDLGFDHAPFRGRRGFYPGPQQLALAGGIERALTAPDAVVTVTGPVGAGKSAGVRYALDRLPGSTSVARVGRVHLPCDELLELLLDEFGIAQKPSGTLQRIAAFGRLLQGHASAGTRVVVVVEDAGRLGADLLAELESLTACDADDFPGANLVLQGDPELARFLQQPMLARLKQRVRRNLRLEAFSLEETKAYLDHRLAGAGARREDIFDEGAIDVIQQCSEGVARMINALGEALLLAAGGPDGYPIGAELARRVARDEFGLDPGAAAATADTGAGRAAANGDSPPPTRPVPAAVRSAVGAGPAANETAATDDDIPALIQDTQPSLAALELPVPQDGVRAGRTVSALDELRARLEPRQPERLSRTAGFADTQTLRALDDALKPDTQLLQTLDEPPPPEEDSAPLPLGLRDPFEAQAATAPEERPETGKAGGFAVTGGDAEFDSSELPTLSDTVTMKPIAIGDIPSEPRLPGTQEPQQPAFTPEAAAHSAAEDDARSTPDAAPQSAPDAAPQSAPEAAARSVPDAAPQSAAEAGARELPDAVQAAPQSAPRSVPEVMPQSGPESTPAAGPRSDPESTAEATPRSGIEGSESRPEFAAESAPELAPEAGPEAGVRPAESAVPEAASGDESEDAAGAPEAPVRHQDDRAAASGDYAGAAEKTPASTGGTPAGQNTPDDPPPTVSARDADEPARDADEPGLSANESAQGADEPALSASESAQGADEPARGADEPAAGEIRLDEGDAPAPTADSAQDDESALAAQEDNDLPDLSLVPEITLDALLEEHQREAQARIDEQAAQRSASSLEPGGAGNDPDEAETAADGKPAESEAERQKRLESLAARFSNAKSIEDIVDDSAAETLFGEEFGQVAAAVTAMHEARQQSEGAKAALTLASNDDDAEPAVAERPVPQAPAARPAVAERAEPQRPAEKPAEAGQAQPQRPAEKPAEAGQAQPQRPAEKPAAIPPEGPAAPPTGATSAAGSTAPSPARSTANGAAAPASGSQSRPAAGSATAAKPTQTQNSRPQKPPRSPPTDLDSSAARRLEMVRALNRKNGRPPPPMPGKIGEEIILGDDDGTPAADAAQPAPIENQFGESMTAKLRALSAENMRKLEEAEEKQEQKRGFLSRFKRS